MFGATENCKPRGACRRHAEYKTAFSGPEQALAARNAGWAQGSTNLSRCQLEAAEPAPLESLLSKTLSLNYEIPGTAEGLRSKVVAKTWINETLVRVEKDWRENVAKPRTKKMKGDRDGDWLSFHHFLGRKGLDAGIRTQVYIVLYL